MLRECSGAVVMMLIHMMILTMLAVKCVWLHACVSRKPRPLKLFCENCFNNNNNNNNTKIYNAHIVKH